ncbi:unnamed protein product [Blepharisma stoltei]|uniref:Uncharacterized protein n=1 Tax=Blepharisma stoltei TaxID=1481888 RepID=A0AAU9JVU0_9CILI|nr:unnamed protein product [Blepharisma stoltei]
MKINNRDKLNLLNTHLDSAEALKNIDYQSLDPTLLKLKTSAILSKACNDAETEQDFRRICSIYGKQSPSSNSKLIEAYLEYISAYHKITTLHIFGESSEGTNLIAYNTENELENIKLLNTTSPWDCSTCIAQIPNGELFCFGAYYPDLGNALLIKKNYEVREELPFGKYCYGSSAIYFNRHVYCFGGACLGNDLTLSNKFDLDNNRWIELAQMPQADYMCKNVIFNGKIVISGWRNANLLVYSIDIDSFSIIPYDFEENNFKIVVNLERLYLIECGRNRFIYESEIEDEYTWKKIAKTNINCDIYELNYLYNKGGIYIIVYPEKRYFKFDLNKKTITEIE